MRQICSMKTELLKKLGTTLMPNLTLKQTLAVYENRIINIEAEISPLQSEFHTLKRIMQNFEIDT